MAIANVVERDFGSEVLKDPGPVVVAFRAAWCAPSQQMSPLIDEVAERFGDRVKVVAVDVDTEPSANKICRQYKVNRLPMTMVFREGRVADFVGGAVSPEIMLDMVERQVRPVLDVNEINFDAEVLKSPVPVLVHVAARWCAASLELVPAVEATAERFRGRAKVVRLEHGPENARLLAQYGFARVPTLALFHRGQIEDQIFGQLEGGTKTEAIRTSCVGLTTEDTIAQMIDGVAL